MRDHHVHPENGPYDPHTYPLTWLERFVDQARQAGVEEIGLVEHAYRFVEARGLLDIPYARERCRYALGRYVAVVERARQSGLPLALGLEVDYVPGKEKEIRRFLDLYPWDFVLGSVHVLGDFPLDLDPADWKGRDVDQVWDAYVDTSVRAVESGLFHVLTHPDLPKIWGFWPRSRLEERYARLARALEGTGMAMEVNTRGLRRPVGQIYPHPTLVRMAREAGIAVTLASDAHEPDHVGYAFPEARKLLWEAGYDQVWAVRKGKLVPEPLPPP